MTNAFQQVWKTVTGIPAAGGLERYKFAAINASGLATKATTGQMVIGVSNEPNAEGEAAQIVAEGIFPVVLEAALAPGTVVMAGAAGGAVAYAAGEVDPNHAVGVLVVGGSAGDLGSVLMK